MINVRSRVCSVYELFSATTTIVGTVRQCSSITSESSADKYDDELPMDLLILHYLKCVLRLFNVSVLVLLIFAVRLSLAYHVHQ